MHPATSTPRLLLNRLRQMMAGEGESKERLNKIVQLVAGNMVAEVCSIYLRTDDNHLLLAATQGLRPSAVSKTKLRFDEGLVGQIAQTAQPLSIQDAPLHPNFSYRPETGEDPFHAFLGVPILRSGRVIGVLTLQNRTERTYGIEEIEALETIAMVLAEVIANQAVLETGQSETLSIRNIRRVTFQGRVLSDGIGIGKARLHDPVFSPAKLFADDPEIEAKRLDEALVILRRSVDYLVSSEISTLGDDPRDVMEVYKLLANDASWTVKLHEGIRGGLTAEASVDRVRREHRARMETARDPYLKDRLHDLEDLDNRLLRVLSEDKELADQSGSILIARRLGPAELLEYSNAGLKAIAIEETAISSHATIVARALGIAAIGGMEGLITAVESGDTVIIDAESGIVHIRPDEHVLSSFKTKQTLRSERQAEFRALRDLPSCTKNGETVGLFINAGLPLDLDYLETTGAEGVGLFRTEFQFLVSETLPKLDDQIKYYRRIIDSSGGRTVIFRTVDLGGDKILPNLNRQREENPALGWRSIRFALDKKGFFQRQLRALIRASANKPLSIMFPMVAASWEYFEAKELLLKELEYNKKKGQDVPTDIRFGVMLETPSLAFALDEIAGNVDFLSVGTNDLMQFFYAADRMDDRIATRFDLISRPAMRFLQLVSEKSAKYGIKTSVCGEHTGNPLAALCLVALGFHQLSMPASGIGPVKKQLRSTNMAKFREIFLQKIEGSGVPLRKEINKLLINPEIVEG